METQKPTENYNNMTTTEIAEKFNSFPLNIEKMAEQIATMIQHRLNHGKSEPNFFSPTPTVSVDVLEKHKDILSYLCQNVTNLIPVHSNAAVEAETFEAKVSAVAQMA